MEKLPPEWWASHSYEQSRLLDMETEPDKRKCTAVSWTFYWLSCFLCDQGHAHALLTFACHLWNGSCHSTPALWEPAIRQESAQHSPQSRITDMVFAVSFITRNTWQASFLWHWGWMGPFESYDLMAKFLLKTSRRKTHRLKLTGSIILQRRAVTDLRL